MSRQKQVYDTDQIAHLWMHKAQASARNPQYNLYFEGDTIYSYGSHFPIARHVTNKAGESAVLYTTETYGPTTGRHLSLVSRAIPNSTPVFRVPDPTRDIKRQLEYRKQRFADARKVLLDAKDKRARVKAVKALEDVAQDAKAFASFFGYSTRQFEVTLPKSYPYTPSQLQGEVNEYDAAFQRRSEAAQRAADTRRAERNARWARQSEEYAAERERRRLEEETRKAIFQTHAAEIMQAWRDGASLLMLDGKPFTVPSYLGSVGLPTLLRVDGNEVVTSLGARFPLAHARLGLRMVQRCRETKTDYKRNGHTIHLGHYAIDSIDAEGNVKAGCHHVMWDEISRLAPVLEAMEVSQ